MSENQLKIMLDSEEDKQNTSMSIMLKDFKRMAESGSNFKSCTPDELRELPPYRATTAKCHTQGDEDSGEKQYFTRQNYTARDNLELNYDNLNEIFQEFKEVKYGIKKEGQRTAQHKDISGDMGRMSVQQFLNIQNQKCMQKPSQSKESLETQEDREKRLFNMIKQRQSLMNGSAVFLKDDLQSEVDDANEVRDENGLIIANIYRADNSIDFENVNTSTFGYAINHNNRRSQLLQSIENQHSLNNENGLMSTVSSKMNKRYITNQLIESDSSIEDNIINGKLPLSNHIESNENFNYKENFTTGSKQKYSSNSKKSGLSDVEPIMIYGDENEEDVKALQSELLSRILTRYTLNSDIINLKAGFIAFLKNCIDLKKAINLFQILQKITGKREVEDQAMFLTK